MYDRIAVSFRVIEIYPTEDWSNYPEIYDEREH
jgi:hypothetical protein